MSKDGPVHPGTLQDLHSVEGTGIGEFLRLACDLQHRLSDFIHRVVVHRRDEAIRAWRNWLREDARVRNWLREDPLVHPYTWLGPDVVPPAPFLQCEAHLTPGG